jgi:hypothetical protein
MASERRQFRCRQVAHHHCQGSGIKTIIFVRRPELVPELQAIGGDLVDAGEDVTLDKIRAAVGNGRMRLAIDGVAGKSRVTASLLSPMGPSWSIRTWAEGFVAGPAEKCFSISCIAMTLHVLLATGHLSMPESLDA